MGYILEFKDDFEKQEVIDKLYKLKRTSVTSAKCWRMQTPKAMKGR